MKLHFSNSDVNLHFQ